jgi:osmotically-inducible protein OsmY
MKLKLIATAMIAAGLALSGCASHKQNASAGESRSAAEFGSDAALTTKVKAALAKDAGLGTAANVNVQSYRGVVQLNGFVNTDEQIRSAGDVAGRIEGVSKVENNLKVKPAS